MAEAAHSKATTSSGGSGLRFWKKKKRTPSSKDGGPEDASKTGCGAFFGRKGRKKTIGERAPDAVNGSSTHPPASQKVQISFDDVELSDAKLPHVAAAGASCHSSHSGSVHSICEEIVCIKVKAPESAWVRPPVQKVEEAAGSRKPKMALSKMASKEGPPPPQPAADKPPRRRSSDKTPPETTLTKVDPDDDAELERQKMAEAKFQRKSVDMRNVKAKGGVKIEQSPQSEMWWNIVNKSLVGTGVFVRAAACSLQTGGIFACNPADFAPAAEQVAALRDNFQNVGAFAAAGFAIGGVIYKVEQGACTRDLLSAVNLQHTEGLLVVKCQTAMLIAGFTGARDQARETLCDMRDLFVSQGL